ncbi:hypothetical protein FB45DRAFT_945755 [Roridomyces roridus]|uniref:Uncharacterized protein n=1 Tax=Roridomyces roridus TaxID=1738132 RepID=A0AAD7B3B9_9AGAR|nr:hypothetical protein FB45DRAFT_945755 [Roridomyces roridus]
MQEDTARRWLEELQLIQFTLLPEEILTFLDDGGSVWAQLLDDYDESTTTDTPSSPPHIQVKPKTSTVWFEALFSSDTMPKIAVKSDTATRAEQERWQEVVRSKLDEVAASQFPIYELLCLHLLPLLHEAESADAALDSPHPALLPADDANAPRFHALFTSHHLISPKKRRALQGWSASLRIAGFAKVGYPGVIYAQGTESSVEEFVANVKGMQWLALKLRFLEPLPLAGEVEAHGWTELEKVGEAVEAMRRLGLEEWIVEMGIGSGKNSER